MSDQDHRVSGTPALLSRDRPRGALHALREGNLQRILGVISGSEGLSQAEVARRTQLSRATVSNLVAELRRRGLLRLADGGPGGRGALEPAVPRSGVVVGVDFGYHHVRVGVADLGGRVLAAAEHSLPRDFDVDESCSEAR